MMMTTVMETVREVAVATSLLAEQQKQQHKASGSHCRARRSTVTCRREAQLRALLWLDRSCIRERLQALALQRRRRAGIEKSPHFCSAMHEFKQCSWCAQCHAEAFLKDRMNSSAWR